jgi:hypothetical protein
MRDEFDSSSSRRGGEMYIDPTAGSLLLQFIAAGVLSAVAMFSRVRQAVKAVFKSLLPGSSRWTGKR